MNPDKAREYFSAYYEGTLEKGLAESFERALRTDAQIQAEYRSFERLLGELELLKQPVPEPEFDLHEIISRRLDKQIFEQKRRVSFSLLGWWKSVALGGLAMVALVTAVFQLKSSGGTSTTDILLAPSAIDKVELHSTQSGYAVFYRSKDKRSIAIHASDGSVLSQKEVEGGTLSFPLTNPNPTASLLQVEIVGQPAVTYVALPGTRMQPNAAGDGTIKDLAVALAGYYREPVLLTLGQEIAIKWQFTPGEARGAVERALTQTSYSVVKNGDGIIAIQPN